MSIVMHRIDPLLEGRPQFRRRSVLYSVWFAQTLQQRVELSIDFTYVQVSDLWKDQLKQVLNGIKSRTNSLTIVTLVVQ